MSLTLTLAGGYTLATCPTCKGKGRVPCPVTGSASGAKTISSGHPIPCPECQGTKVVPVPEDSR